MTIITRPSMTDDSGALTDGTVVNKSFMDDIMDEVDDQCHSATNTTTKPKATTDEVVTARGSKASLDARLDVSLNDDGTLKTQASLVTATQAGGLPQGNLIMNDTFMIWPSGDAAAPAGWALTGAGAAIARAGTGLADTKRKVGDFCAKLTYGSANLLFRHTVLPAAAYSRLDHLDGEKVSFGIWVWASAASQVRPSIYDGATATYDDEFHAGDSAWQWMSLSHTISGSATTLAAQLYVTSGAANPVYVSGPTMIFGDVEPVNWRPAPVTYGTLVHKVAGACSVDTQVDTFIFQRPAIVKDVQLYAETAPTGQALIVDVNGGNGTNSMFSTLPQLDDGDKHGNGQPDGTYQYRCFDGYTGDTPTASMLTSEVTQIGSGATGSDLTIMIRAMVYNDPFEAYKAA